MGKKRKFWINKTKGVVVGRFHELVCGSDHKNPPLHELCDLEELNSQPPEERDQFLEKLYQQQLETIKTKKRFKLRSYGFQGPIIELMGQWLQEIGQTRSIRTFKDYEMSVRYYKAAFGDRLTEDFEVGDGAKLMSFLKAQGLAIRSVYKHLSNLQSFFNWAYRNQLIKREIRLPKPRKIKKEPVVYSRIQLKTIETFIKNIIRKEKRPDRIKQRINQLRTFKMAIYTAMRGGEIWSLKLCQIRLDLGCILIHDVPEINFYVKSRREERIPIAKELEKFLIEDLSNRRRSEVWYLDNGIGEQIYASESKLARPFSIINKILGISGVKPLHGIRASVITQLLEDGCEITSVQKLACHQMITTTKGYQNTANLDIRHLVDSIQLLKPNLKIIEK